MKKIIVGKEDGVAEVIDQMLNEPDPEVTFVIPRGSSLGRTVSNFHLLRREADAAGRDIAIESVDETILAFAKQSKIESTHPLWRGVRGAGVGVSDIVSKSHKSVSAKREPEEEDILADDDEQEAGEEEEAAPRPVHTPMKGKRIVAVHAKEETIDDEADGEEAEAEPADDGEEEEPVSRGILRKPFFSSIPRYYRHDDDADDDEDSSRRRGISGKVWAWVAVIIVLVAGGAYVASADFNHATISIAFKKTPWSWQGSLTADKSISSDALASNVIAGQVFTSNKNVTESFKASSVQNVSLKAQGIITIYNDYGTSPQELVATTRFLTPDGKIFRITQNVIVPGATTSGGKLVPSSINAPIVADQAGPDYNIGPVAKLTIPGFAGHPQENGFYGTITATTTGGYTGQKAVPTAADIAAAEASTTAILQASLQGGFSGSYPNNFKILDGATSIQVGKLTVNTTTDSQGDFTVYGQAMLSAIGFDETALKSDLLAEAQTQDPSSTFSDINMNYGNVQANFSKGQVSFSLSAQGDLEPAFSTTDFVSEIAGKNISDARNMIGALPQLSSGEISVWPSWLWTIPSNTSKVHITAS